MEIFLPDRIRAAVNGIAFSKEGIGMSGAGVWISDEAVLKIEKCSESTKRQNMMLRWLRGKLQAPEIICEEQHDDVLYTLMTRIHGEMACSEANMKRPNDTVAAIAEGLRMLWTVDISDCPIRYTLADMIKDAEKHIAAADTSAWKGHFETPEKQLEWLANNMPDDEFVFAHGDYCMPNIMIEGRKVKGFVDMAQCGAADRWYDISLMQQSLERNFSGFFGGPGYDGFRTKMLFEELNISLEKERLEFHLLLDELYSV